MNATEAGLVLTKASAYDRRTVGRVDSEAWADAMTRADVPLPDALEAVALHFQDSNDWLMPNHIIGRVRAARRVVGRDRLARAGEAPYPPGLSQAQERAWLRVWMDSVKAGDPDPMAGADAALGIARAAEQLTPRPDRVQLITALASTKGIVAS